jgi:4-amino-4-deoxy-L-arabinose transferase-like glycosyltransferase
MMTSETTTRRPAPHHLALAGVLAFSAVMNTHRLAQNGYANIFYSAGVKSMLRSLHNFVFASFDPGGLVTVDKPPLALWVQVASAKVFGFSPLSLLLPEAIMGVLAVALLYLLVSRPFGAGAGLAAALTLAVFPSFVGVVRDNGVDPLLILLMLLACGAALRAIETGRWRTIVWSGVLVGLAFNTKTLAAYLVIPGIALGYVVCAPGPFSRRVLRLLVAGLAMVAVSVAWIAFVDETPAAKRPFVGSSTNNSEVGLTFEYNGFGRVEGQVGGPGHIPVGTGALPSSASPSSAHRTPRSGTRTHAGARPTARAKPRPPSRLLPDGREREPIPFGGPVGPLRLFGLGLGDQSGWILPFAFFGLLAVVALLGESRTRSRRLRRGRGSTARAASNMAPRAGSDAVGTEERSASATASPLGTPFEKSGTPDASLDTALDRHMTARTCHQHALHRPATPSLDHERPTAPLFSKGVPGPAVLGRRDPRLAATLVLGGWFLVEAAVLSLSKGIVHPYYTSALAPGAAAMAGAGAGAFVRLRTSFKKIGTPDASPDTALDRRATARTCNQHALHRPTTPSLVQKRPAAPLFLKDVLTHGQRWDWRLLTIPCAVATTVIAQVVVLHREHYMHWFVPVLIAGATIGTITLLAVRRSAPAAMAFTLVLLLAASGAYASTTWLAPVEGTFPAAGPKQATGAGGVGIAGRDLRVDLALLRYVRARRPGSRWAILTDASDTAAPFILLDLPAGALGGYGGTDPVLDGAGLARLVSKDQARYVVLGGEYSTRGGNRATVAVKRACRELPVSAWGGPPAHSDNLVLFDCAGRERELAAAP